MTSGGWGAAVPEGWYPDPWAVAPLRWWDGRAWTGWTGPAAAIGPAGPLTPGAASGAGLQPWAHAAVIGYPMIQALAAVVYLAGMGSIRDAVHAFEAQARLAAPGQTTVLHLPAWTSLLSLAQLAAFGLAVPFFVWQHRVANEARRRGYPARRSPGMGVGSWFIPVASLWMPYQALLDCLPPGHPSRRMALPAWLAFLVGGVLTTAALVAGYFSVPAGVVVLVVGGAGWAALAVLGWRLIAVVGADQATSPGQPSGQGGWQTSQA